MKHFILFSLLLFGLSIYAQEQKPIAEKIAEHHRNNDRFATFHLFTKNPSPAKLDKYEKAATDITVLNLDPAELQRLMDEKPKTIEISFPYKDEQITVELFKEIILTADFAPVDETSKRIEYEPGIYYRGILKNDPSSLVAFSFFENTVMGIASVLGKGNIVVGKAENASDYLSYADHSLTMANPFKCGADDLPENKNQNPTENEPSGEKSMAIPNCVRVYYEVAYSPYMDNGGDVTATLDWITAVHNNIGTLYSNDNIQTALSDVLIWTTPDPYDFGFSGNLAYFRSHRLAFDADLAHLVNSPSTTSVAYLNSLCGQSRYAYSGINLYYAEVPTYSWTIMAMTHEMGHALGSPHTHSCAWNGNNTAIDGCGPASGNDEGCNAALPPSGTIMSYCHLIPSVGINFVNGFGSQPAERIRNTIAGKNCLGTDCLNSCVFSVDGLSFTNITNSSATVQIDDAVSTNWEYRIYPINLWATNWDPVGSEFDISGLQSNTYYVVEVRNICNTGGSIGTYISQTLLTDGEYCDGDLFLDSGGVNDPYTGPQNLVKTFYPDVPGTLTMTFSSFDLENGYDFMSIYDGETTDAPVFANGENLTGTAIPDPFTSTNPEGAITVEFIADEYVAGSGWEATISCAPLSVENFSGSIGLSIYPNPASTVINIESKVPMQQIEIYDLLGRLVKQKKNVETSKTDVQLSGMEDGVYFIQVKAENNFQTIKLVKE